MSRWISWNLSLLSAIVAFFCCTHNVGQAFEDAAPVDPSGTWRWEYELGGETLKDSLQLNLGPNNTVVGTYKGRSENLVEIKDGKLDGDKLSFNFGLDFQGTPIKLEFTGKIRSDMIDGNVVVVAGDNKRDYPWAPHRSARIEDVVGEWRFRIETDGNTLEPSLKITREGDTYKGRYVSGQQISVDVTDLRVEENHLMFTVSAEVDGTKIKGDYRGRPYGDKIKGSIAYVLGDRTGDIEFTGTRKSATPAK
jgi:hypothetical protein